MTTSIRLALLSIIATLTLPSAACAADRLPITIRTETFPRPPYSEATYYVYERDGKVICTKLAVCDKYDECDTTYHAGAFKDPADVQTGKPYGGSPAALIAEAKLRKHQCLAKFVPDAL